MIGLIARLGQNVRRAATGILGGTDDPPTPSLELAPREDELVVRAGIPAIYDLDDLELAVEGTVLVLRGRPDGVERRGFVRTIPLPQGALVADIRAVYAGGTLEIVVPRHEGTLDRTTIDIERRD